jgi:hypothetical protein
MGLEAVRAVRQRISEEVGHDARRLVDRYRDLEREHADRIVHAPQAKPVAAGPVTSD